MDKPRFRIVFRAGIAFYYRMVVSRGLSKYVTTDSLVKYQFPIKYSHADAGRKCFTWTDSDCYYGIPDVGALTLARG